MYILNGLAKTAQDETLRAAARTQLSGQVYAARRPGNRSDAARRLAGLRILRARRAAQAY
jgi:hypothetical protein